MPSRAGMPKLPRAETKVSSAAARAAGGQQGQDQGQGDPQGTGPGQPPGLDQFPGDLPETGPEDQKGQGGVLDGEQKDDPGPGCRWGWARRAGGARPRVFRSTEEGPKRLDPRQGRDLGRNHHGQHEAQDQGQLEPHVGQGDDKGGDPAQDQGAHHPGQAGLQGMEHGPMDRPGIKGLQDESGVERALGKDPLEKEPGHGPQGEETGRTGASPARSIPSPDKKNLPKRPVRGAPG